MDQTINANMAQCIKSVTHIGHNAHHNICNGTVTNLPWGAGEWVLALFLAATLVGLVLILASLLKMMWFERL